ncbi:MAG: FHA domain-containing protein [Gammaproteobacteria bacterium]|nr:FHA domain-containing protein [Gammaproteobacteria bacterium]
MPKTLLIELADGEARRTIRCTRFPVTLGASADCDIRLEGEDVPPYLANIWLKEGEFSLSINSPRLAVMRNGFPLSTGEPLRSGELLYIGPYSLSLREEAVVAPAPAPEVAAATAFKPAVSLDWYLAAETGLLAGKGFPVAKAETVFGRESDCDIAIPASGVSRRHARLLLTGAGLAVEDLGSTNGSFVNEERITGRRNLAHGDLLRIDDSRFRVNNLKAAKAAQQGAQQAPAPKPAETRPRVAEVAASSVRPSEAVTTVPPPKPGLPLWPMIIGAALLLLAATALAFLL